jgi:SAM-dependent methyltransferase
MPWWIGPRHRMKMHRYLTVINKVYQAALALLYAAGLGCYCCICGHYLRRFLPFRGRRNAECPNCGSLARHRLLWKFLSARTKLFDRRPKQVLHFAPERGVRRRLTQYPQLSYVAADLAGGPDILPVDVTAMKFPDSSFDVVICNHVLEHVDDDRKAMAELHRVLRPGGWAVITTPIRGVKTLEDPAVTQPHMRKELFGQENHVRRYGRDIVGRLQDAGFRVEIYQREDLAGPHSWQPLGLDRGIIFFCTR